MYVVEMLVVYVVVGGCCVRGRDVGGVRGGGDGC